LKQASDPAAAVLDALVSLIWENASARGEAATV
jgi:hypothetical protein